MTAGKRTAGVFSAKTVVGTATVLFLLALWQINSAVRLVDPLFVSTPWQVLQAGIAVIRSGAFFRNWSASLIEFLVGTTLAVIFGVLLGCAIGRFRILSHLFDPMIMALYAMPRVTIIPLIVIWFGIGMSSKEVVVFLGAVFPVLINAAAGIKQVDPALVRAAKSFGASEAKVFSRVLLPGAFPFIVSGIRLGIGRGVIGFVIAEMYAATRGVGYALMNAGEVLQTNELLFYAFSVIIFGYGIILLFDLLEAHRMRHLEEKRIFQ